MDPVTLARIAHEVGTPVYVYDLPAIRRQVERLRAALDGIPHAIHYSVKANSNLGVLRYLRELGCGADIVSGGELARARAVQFPPEHVVFSGVGKRPDELREAVEAGIGLINVESAGEVELLATLASEYDRDVSVGIRVNPDVMTETHPYTQTGSRSVKFGVPVDDVAALAARCALTPQLELRAVGMHIGSQITRTEPYREGARKLQALVGTLRANGVTTLRWLDLGGGFAVPLGADGAELDLDAFADAVRQVIDETGLELLVEPGRFLVANAGYLVTRVLYRKHAGGREITVVDAGMTELIRPTLYQAVHQVSVLEPGSSPDGAAALDIVGPVCETGDFLALDRTLAGVSPGALLAVHGAGAYGFTMSSNYNSRLRPPEVLADGSKWAVARTREHVDDLLRHEVAEPVWQ